MRFKHLTGCTGFSYNTVSFSVRVERMRINKEAISKKLSLPVTRVSFPKTQGQKML